MSHAVHFDCTMCGRCCRDLHLPLTMPEALSWLADGNEVEVLCTAMPWPVEPPATHAESAYRRARSFVAGSGSLRVRINVMLAANLVGACPNLGPNMHCRIHPRRPGVCRIYPYEINPFVALQPADKACPPEAWSEDRPILQTDCGVVSDDLQTDVQAARKAAVDGVGAGRLLCHLLGLRTAAVANEGYVIHPIERRTLAAALRQALATDTQGAGQDQHWDLVSDRPLTLDALAAVGAAGLPGPGREARPYRHRNYRYLGMRPTTQPGSGSQPAATPLMIKPSP
jgi:Fe-S-cluster containining protein